MGRGLAIGLLIGFVAFSVYVFWRETQTPPPPPTVDELKAQVRPDQLDLARTSPQLALAQAKSENYPVFLAFLDTDLGVTQAVADDYRQIFDRVCAYYGNDTRGQVVQAVFRIHEASVYYPTINYRESLEYIQDTVPAGFTPPSEESEDSDDAKGSGVSNKSIREVAEEIYQYLVASYMQPEWDAMQAKMQENEQLNQRINENLQAARARGASINAARAQALSQHNSRLQHNVDVSFNNYQYDTVNYGINRYWRYGRRW